MRSLTYVAPRNLRWDDLPEPELPDEHAALVRPFAAARCDLDAIFLRENLFRRYQLGRLLRLVDPTADNALRPDLFKGPFPLGHEGVAEVLECGREVRSFARGAQVIVPFQIACGECPTCTRGLTAHCEVHGAFDMYSGIGKHTHRGGMLSDVVVVPHADRMLVRVPDGLDPLTLASGSDNLPDAWSRVAPELLGQPGKRVLVIGGSTRSIALYCVALAVAMNAGEVHYVDEDPERQAIATRLGATPLPLPAPEGHYDLVVNGSNRRDAIARSVERLAPGGVCTTMNIYMTRSTPVPFFQLYAKNLTLKTGLANPSADLPAMLDFIARERPDIGAVTTQLAPWDDAASAMLEDTTKVVVWREPLGA